MISEQHTVMSDNRQLYYAKDCASYIYVKNVYIDVCISDFKFSLRNNLLQKNK